MHNDKIKYLAIAAAFVMVASVAVIPLGGDSGESDGAVVPMPGEKALVGGASLAGISLNIGEQKISVDRLDINLIGKVRETENGYVAELELACVGMASMNVDAAIDIPEDGEYLDGEFFEAWGASLGDGIYDDPQALQARAALKLALAAYVSVVMDKDYNILSVVFDGKAYVSAMADANFTLALGDKDIPGLLFEKDKPMSEWIALAIEAEGSIVFSEPLNLFNKAGVDAAWTSAVQKAALDIEVYPVLRMSDGLGAMLEKLLTNSPQAREALFLDQNGFPNILKMSMAIPLIEVKGTRDTMPLGETVYSYDVNVAGSPATELSDILDMIGNLTTYVKILDTALVPMDQLKAYYGVLNDAESMIGGFLGSAQMTVVFGNGAGGEIGRETVGYGGNAHSMPALKKAGFEFVGWTAGGVLWDFNDPVKSDMTLQPLYGMPVDNFLGEPWKYSRCLIADMDVIPVAEALIGMLPDSVLVVRTHDGERTHTWTFYGKDMPFPPALPFLNVSLKVSDKAIDADAAKAVEGRTKPVFLDFYEGGAFPKPVDIKCDVSGLYGKGTNLTLYRIYNGELVSPQKCIVGDDGCVSISALGGYDHVLVADGPGQAPAGDAAFVGIGAVGLIAVGAVFFLGRGRF